MHHSEILWRKITMNHFCYISHMEKYSVHSSALLMQINVCRLLFFLQSHITAQRVCTLFVWTSPKDAVSHTVVTHQKHSSNEDDAAYCAWLPLQEKPSQVQHEEHGMVVKQGRIKGFRDEKNRNQPLKAIHCAGRLVFFLSDK